MYYDNWKDYPKKRNNKKEETFVISKWELEKYALLNAIFNGHLLSKEGRIFYTSLYNIAIKENDNQVYVCKEDYKCAESSYKVAISFAMGMIAARIVAMKKYDIIHMFHLKDKSIKYSPKGGKIPDWFGIDSYGNPYLFESKGTDRTSVSQEVIEEAEKQLSSIKCVTDMSGSKKKIYSSSFNKRVVVSCFRYDKTNDIRDRWYIQDVDPEGEGEIDISINLDEQCYKQYKTVVLFMESLNTLCEEVEINQQKYIFYFYENEKLGIHKTIYDEVKSDKYTDSNKYINFYKNINEVLMEIECEKDIEDSSLYRDGIIVCSRDKTYN